MEKYIIGIDPGLTTGITVLRYDPAISLHHLGPPVIIQCNHQSVPMLLAWVLTEYGGNATFIATERFTVGPRAGKSRVSSAGQITRELNGYIVGLASGNVRVVQRSASEVKLWATDPRLDECGLYKITEGMRHARDGARHAVFSAMKDLGIPDPLSSRCTRQAN